MCGKKRENHFGKKLRVFRMNKMIYRLFLFYVITIVLTVILSMVQEKLKIDFEKIIVPQLAPTIAFVIIIQIFSTLKTPLKIQVEKNT